MTDNTPPTEPIPILQGPDYEVVLLPKEGISTLDFYILLLGDVQERKDRMRRARQDYPDGYMGGDPFLTSEEMLRKDVLLKAREALAEKGILLDGPLKGWSLQEGWSLQDCAACFPHFLGEDRFSSLISLVAL
jgi:hypothetical protein